MVRMMGSLVVAIEECKYPAFFMVVFPWQTLQLTSSFVVETTMFRAWHFAHSFWRGGVVGFNMDNIPTTWGKRSNSLTKQINCKTKFTQSIDGMEESGKIIPLSQEVGCLSTWCVS